MKLFTFQNILGIILVVLAVSNVSYLFKKCKSLGEMTVPALKGFKYFDKTQLILLFFASVLIAMSLISTSISSDNLIFYITVSIAALSFVIVAVRMAFIAPGFYKNGVATGSGILLYTEIKQYETLPKKNDSALRIVFNRGGFLSGGSFVYVPAEAQPEVKALLKKKMKFKG